MLETENVSPDEESTTGDETPSAPDESRLKRSPGSKADEQPQNPTNTSPRSPTERSPEDRRRLEERGEAYRRAISGSLNKVRKGNYYEFANLQEFLEMSDEEFKEFSSRKESPLKPSNESLPDTPMITTSEPNPEAEKEEEIVDVKESLGMREKESTKERNRYSGEQHPRLGPRSNDVYAASDAFMERIRRKEKMSQEERVARMQKANKAIRNLFQKAPPENEPEPRRHRVLSALENLRHKRLLLHACEQSYKRQGALVPPPDVKGAAIIVDYVEAYIDEGIVGFEDAATRFIEDVGDLARNYGSIFEIVWYMLRRQGADIDLPGTFPNVDTVLQKRRGDL